MKTCYVKFRLGTTSMGEPYSLHQSLMSTLVLRMAEYYSDCSHIVSIHFLMDTVPLSTSLLLIPSGFSFFCLCAFPQGLNYPVLFKVTWTWYFLLPLVSPSDPPPLWAMHSLVPWQAQVFFSTCSSCCSTQYWRKCLAPCTVSIPILLVKREELHKNTEIS